MKRINSNLKKFWGIGEVGFAFMSTMETSFFIIFLTDVAKLPLAFVAIITGFSGIADAITAVLAGAIIDKVSFKNGKYRPWLIYCPPFVVIFFILMFTKIGGNVTTMVICSLGYILSHGIWNIAWTANRALIGVLSDDPEERAFLSGRIGAGSSGGKILASYFVPILTSAFLGLFIGLGDVWGYTATAAVVSISFLITYFIHYQLTKGYDLPEEGTSVHKKSVTLMDMLKAIVANPQLLILLIADALRLIGFYMIAACAVFYAKIVLEDPSMTAIILVIYNFGTFVGSLLSKKVVVKLGTKKASVIGTGGMAVLLILLYVMPSNTLLVFTLLFAAQVIFGSGYGLTTSMYSMCGTESEYRTGKNTKGVIMACSSLAIKIAIALRGMVISAALAFIAYAPDGPITEAGKSGIKLVFFVIPAAFCIVSALAFLLYKIKDADIARMEQEIMEKQRA